MPIAAVVIGLALVVLIVALTPAGRRLVATGRDVVDGSVAMFAIRRTLGLDTTTARQRRIDQRHAREQAEIMRRIGGPGWVDDTPSSPVAPLAVAPNRLVVSGDPMAPTGRRDPRANLVRDGAIAAIGIGAVVLTVSLLGQPPSGAVLGATATPVEQPGTVSTATPSVVPSPIAPATMAPVSSAPAAVPASPTASAALAVEQPHVAGLTARLASRSAGGRTVAVTLAWKLASGSAPADAFRLYRRVDDGAEQPVGTLDGGARSTVVRLGVGRASTFRIEAIGRDGAVSPAMTWPPITASRHQESSGLVTTRGAWREASGPSLSGGDVIYSRQAGATITFAFRGSDIGWVGTLTPAGGTAQVRLDGRLVRTVDLAAARVRYRQLLARVHVTGDGPHVLSIRVVGDGRVDVDAFIVLH
jgi:hypothetical protein